jgi:hypothetical protein
MEINFLEPISESLLAFIEGLSSQHLGRKMVLHSPKDFPDLNKIKIAIVGVLEDRNENNQQKKVDLTSLRKHFYAMFPGNWSQTIADLGDIKAGETKKDTFFALQQVLNDLLKRQIVPIVIGGTQDLTYPMFRAYDLLDQMVNLVAIDSKFDFGKDKEPVNNQSYMSQIIMNKPNNLFNYSNIGYQTYYNSQEEIDLIEKLYFDAYRLGEISNDITLAEPIFRDADLVSLDLTSIKSSDSGNLINFSPNGFDGKEICILARYAGISDKLSSFGIFNHSNTHQEFVLISQILWYFIEGFNYRSNEYPYSSKESYVKYNVLIDENQLVFYKSDKTERWWIETTFFNNVNNKLKNSTLIPCSYNDYLEACNQQIPERWWKSYKKSMI